MIKTKKLTVSMIVVLVIVVLLFLSLYIFNAVSSSKKKESANKAFIGYVSELLKSDEDENNIVSDNRLLYDLPETDTQTADFLKKVGKKIKIDVTNKKVDGNTIKLKVQVTSLDFKSIILNSYDKLKSLKTSENVEELMFKEVNSYVDSGKASVVKTNLEVVLVSSGKDWAVENKQKLDDAVYPGFKDALETINTESIDFLRNSNIKK